MARSPSAKTVTATVTDRTFIVRNHTATHLLNLALREVLGDHVEQKGSLVDADKTRFDFSHDKPLSADEIRRVEEIVNAQILRDQPVTAITMPLAEAKKLPGVRAVFGEKYPDPVRVVMIGAEKASDVERPNVRRVLRRHASFAHEPGGAVQDRRPGERGQGRSPGDGRHRPAGG